MFDQIDIIYKMYIVSSQIPALNTIKFLDNFDLISQVGVWTNGEPYALISIPNGYRTYKMDTLQLSYISTP